MNILFSLLSIMVLVGVYLIYDFISNKEFKISRFLKRDIIKFVLSIITTIILVLIIAKVIDAFTINLPFYKLKRVDPFEKYTLYFD